VSGLRDKEVNGLGSPGEEDGGTWLSGVGGGDLIRMGSMVAGRRVSKAALG
jgi:hypothetical protein